MNQYNSAKTMARAHEEEERKRIEAQTIVLKEQQTKQQEKEVENAYKYRAEKREKVIVGISVVALIISLISLIVAVVK